MTANIEISTRGKCIDFTGTANHCEISGLIIERASSAGSDADGNYCVNAGGTTRRSGIVINNCLVRDSYRTSRAYGAIWLGLVDDWEIRNTTVQRVYGQIGMFIQGLNWNTSGMASGGRMDRCIVESAENSPFRIWGQEDCVISWTNGWVSGLTAHANKTSMYESCHRVLHWGCNFTGCDGYFTWQEASSVAVAFSEIPVSYITGDGRGINDQNHTTDPSPADGQAINGDSYILNNTVAPFWDATANTNSISLGNVDNPRVKYTGKNNILHGASTVDPTYLMTNGWRNNFLTSGSALAASAGTDQTGGYATVYTDVSTGDISIKASSPTRSASTASLATDLGVLAGWFPDFASQMAYDLGGAAFTAATPPMGAYVDPSNALSVKPHFVIRPTVAGTPIVGGSMSTTGGYYIGFPYPALTYQWVKSTDLNAPYADWTTIGGATSATYSPVSGDINYYLGRITTATNASGTAVVFGYGSTLVSSSFPITDPVVLATKINAWSGSSATYQSESSTFTAPATPVIVTYFVRANSTSADPTPTASIGTPGRSFGTGTAMTLIATSVRGNYQAIPSPSYRLARVLYLCKRRFPARLDQPQWS